MHIAYLVAGIIMLIVWAILFFLRKDLRKEMIVMSLLATPLGLFDFFAVPLYWQPVTLFNSLFSIENVLYTFCLGGVTAVIYAEVARKAPRHMHTWHKSASLIVFTLTLAVLVVIAVQQLFNPAVVLYIALLSGLGATLYFRKDLVKSTIIGALCFGLIYLFMLKLWITLFPETVTWFVFVGMPSVHVWGIPFWELLFGIIFAAYWGNVYELLFGFRLVRKR